MTAHQSDAAPKSPRQARQQAPGLTRYQRELLAREAALRADSRAGNAVDQANADKLRGLRLRAELTGAASDLPLFD